MNAIPLVALIIGTVLVATLVVSMIIAGVQTVRAKEKAE